MKKNSRNLQFRVEVQFCFGEDQSQKILTWAGGTGPACSKVIKRIAGKIAEKKGEQYSHVMGYLRTRLRFSLLRSVLIAVRGVRGKPMKEPFIGSVAFNLVPASSSYDC